MKLETVFEKFDVFADATLAGIALGLVLLASFVMAGRGIGASGAFAAAAGPVAAAITPCPLTAG